MTVALSVQALAAGYGAAAVLHGLDLEVRAGRITVLLGSNGAGKSTLMRVVSGLLTPRSGRIVFDGRDLLALAPHKRVGAGVCLTPEGRSVLPEFTVLENLRMGAYSVRRTLDVGASVDEMFGIFPKLADRRRQLASTLSGGEQQMLAIARSLMSQPKLLLLDEPSLGLAPIVVRQVFSVVEQIRAKGISVLMVEQNAVAALAIADDAYVMEHGRITIHGSAADLRDSPAIRAAYLGL